MPIVDSYSESSYLADQVLADLPLPLANGNFTDCCSDSSYFIPTLRTHNWQTRCWQIYPPSSYGDFTDCCSDSSYVIPTLELIFGRPSVGRSTATWMAILHIAALTAHISFLLWELIFGRPGIGRSTPPHQMAMIDSYSESSYLADQVLADLLLPMANGNFTDYCSESSYFIPTLRTHIWQIYPHVKCQL